MRRFICAALLAAAAVGFTVSSAAAVFQPFHSTKCRGYQIVTGTDDAEYVIHWSKGQKDGEARGATFDEAAAVMRAEIGLAPASLYSPDCV